MPKPTKPSPNPAPALASDGAVKRSISFPGRLLTQAELRAAEDNRSLSNYIQSLVAKDVQQAGQPEPSAAA